MLQGVTELTGGAAPGRPDAEAIKSAAERVRASGALGRSALLASLFDFLVACSAEDRAPKEGEIALTVFGKGVEFETGQDAIVRVYIHRLRSKLEAYAGGAGAEDPVRLTLPRGEYRIVGEMRNGAAAPLSEASAKRRTPSWRWTAAAAAVLVMLNLGVWLVVVRPDDRAEALRSPMWRPFMESGLPLLLVVGDYYVVGETQDGLEMQRLVREFSINSPEELETFRQSNPERGSRYVDLGLNYLPTSSAAQVKAIATLFAGGKEIEVVTASELTPAMLKENDIIYVGYLSGLGTLTGPVLSGRFRVGDSFDEVADTATGRRYASQGAYGPAQGDVYRDYAYLSVLPGPAGNTIAVLAGARDIGAAASAEQASNAGMLKALEAATRSPTGFEALYEVRGQRDVTYDARLIAAAARPQARWAPSDEP